METPQFIAWTFGLNHPINDASSSLFKLLCHGNFFFSWKGVRRNQIDIFSSIIIPTKAMTSSNGPVPFIYLFLIYRFQILWADSRCWHGNSCISNEYPHIRLWAALSNSFFANRWFIGTGCIISKTICIIHFRKKKTGGTSLDGVGLDRKTKKGAHTVRR